MAVADVDRLFDFAVGRPEGFTYEDACTGLGWERAHFYRVARALRRIFGHDDETTLVCASAGQRRPWVYTLVGTPDDLRARFWQTNRIGDLEARLDTSHNVASSLTMGTDPDSIEGRKARKIRNTLGYLKTELADMNQGGGPAGALG